MSEENVEIVRRLYSEWERGNFWTGDYFDQDVHVTWVEPIFASRGETHGLGELSGAMVDFVRTWEHITAAAEQIVAVGERVVAAEVWRARGKASGATTELRQASVFTISAGKVIRMIVYRTMANALEAAEISE